ncbi:MAG: type II toxin-antitoxin system RelE/ParE family toxin [Sediminibacterium sp.]|nr:type II toxin-antitoxin system RelE/ParE family toxin [Sediminibacterium sp.]MDP3129204.1 type II toxin-antitoxin system RelE/ParE family toxin [Sediminibacterium sp.]
MAGKKSNSLWNVLLILGGIWLIAKAFKTPKLAGIGGLQNSKRKLISYINPDGIDELQKDLSNYDRNEIGEIIRTIIDARLRDQLSMPFWKTLKGTIVTGEFRNNQWRIMAYVISNEEYLILNVFKKKTMETPPNEIQKAERRLTEFLNRRGGLYELT